ncbi:MAG TPA: nuclear transport factor 2 family protein [Sphingobium sp.]
MTDHDMAVARDQIRHLIACYNNMADRGRMDEFAALFVEDGVLQITHQALEGREAIFRELSSIASGARPDVDLAGSRHQLTTCRIEMTSEESAEGWTYFFVSRRGTIIEEGTYIDRFIRTPDGWRFAHRRVKMLYSINHKD